MHNNNYYDIKKIIDITGGVYSEKYDDIRITGIKPLDKAGENDLAIFDDLSYRQCLDFVKPALIIVKSGYEGYIKGIPFIIHSNPHSLLPELLSLFERRPALTGIDKNASISPTADIGKGTGIEAFAVIKDRSCIGEECLIGSQCTIGPDVIIGNNTVICTGVKILHGCRIGNNVTIHANTVIGGDGYGYFTDKKGMHRKIPQIGNVIIEDYVEIGSNVSVDRGTMGDTVIGRGTKIDNLVQIAHNVCIGRNCLIVSQVGISGSVILGDNVVIGGQAGIAGHLAVPSGTRIGARSAVIASIKKPGEYAGFPLMALGDFLRNMSAMKKLYQIYTDIKKIKKRLGIKE